MIKHGLPPYLECSSRGDRRFSAFFARINGRSIEELYQAYKVFKNWEGKDETNLSIDEVRGRQKMGLVATNLKEAHAYYTTLWRHYILIQRPDLQPILFKASGLSDMFGKPGHACQATELWKIRTELLKRGEDP